MPIVCCTLQIVVVNVHACVSVMSVMFAMPMPAGSRCNAMPMPAGSRCNAMPMPAGSRCPRHAWGTYGPLPQVYNLLEENAQLKTALNLACSRQVDRVHDPPCWPMPPHRLSLPHEPPSLSPLSTESTLHEPPSLSPLSTESTLPIWTGDAALAERG